MTEVPDDQETDALKDALRDAIQDLIRHTHDDPTLVVSGYILEASAEGLQSEKTALMTVGLPGMSSLVELGLLQYLTVNTEGRIFDSGEDDE